MYTSWKNQIGKDDIHILAEAIDKFGFAIIKNYISEDELSDLEHFAESKVNANNGQYVDIRTTEELRGTILAEIIESEYFSNLCGGLTDIAFGKAMAPADIYHVIRFVKGSRSRRVNGVFHYDSYAVTALLPLIIPDDSDGNLLLMRANRKIRKWYIMNLFDKLLVLNRLSQKWLYSLVRRRDLIIHLPLQPGNLYLFWGYRSLHASEPTAPTTLRATALFHYGDPHANSTLRAHIRALRGRDRMGAPQD